MIQQARDKVKKHIKTHSEHSVEDRAAISLLGTFLNPGGRINTSFAANDTWPNHDGTFEFISNPDVSRRPKQNFFVQIKGTSVYTEKDGIIKYSLKSLAFPAYICDNVSFDPGILFVVLDPDQRGSQRVFWKYMSVDFINSINFDQDSMTIAFSANEEILNTDESVAAFCEKLEMIIDQHSFINQLDSRNYTRRDVEGIIAVCDTEITESIERLDIFNDTRDGVSRRILRRLDDLCSAALLLNAIDAGIDTPTLPLAWERSLLNIETKYLGTFLKGLQYIGKRIPDEGQSERLMLKYYEFLWQIRKSLKEKYEIDILSNLEKFPLHIDQIDRQYYELAAMAVEAVCSVRCDLCASRYYVQKKTPFFTQNQRIIAGNAQFTGIAAGRGVGFTTGLLLLRKGLGMRETPIRPHSWHCRMQSGYQYGGNRKRPPVWRRHRGSLRPRGRNLGGVEGMTGGCGSGCDPAIHTRRLRVYHRPRRLRMASRISIFFAARRFEPLNSMG